VTRLGVTVVALLAAACGPGRVVRGGVVNTDLLATIRTGLVRLRGLEFTAPVPASPLSAADVRARLAHELDETFQPGEIERIAAVEVRLGLLPEGTVLRPIYERLFETQIAAFYDPRAKDLGISTEALGAGGFWIGMLSTLTNHDFVGELLISHELTHALQDQHFGLPTEPEPLTDSHGDRILARRALLEGDATLASFAYVGGGRLDAHTFGLVTEQMHALPAQLAAQYPDVPDAILAPLAFQYDDGTTFTGRAYLHGGWAEVDRVHRDPPTSTEQVLHPERYFERRDPPVEIALGGTDRLEAAGWRPSVEDTVGELGIRILVGHGLSPAGAAAAADGWGGDRLRALARGDDLLLVWMTTWDGEADAVDFAGALPVVRPDARVERRGAHVLVVLAPPGASPPLDALAARVWERTRFTPAG